MDVVMTRKIGWNRVEVLDWSRGICAGRMGFFGWREGNVVWDRGREMGLGIYMGELVLG